MKKIIVLTLFMFMSVSFADGDRARNSTRTVNGDPVKPGTVEWAVSIKDDFGHWCGGSLISPVIETNNGKVSVVGWRSDDSEPEWLLTAAHCFFNTRSDKNKFSYFTGVLDITNIDIGERLKSENVYVHEDYDDKLLSNDIALIKLTKPKKPLNINVRSSIRLPRISDGVWLNKPYTSFYVAGWGVKETDYLSTKLLEAQVPSVEIDYCQKEYSHYGDKLAAGSICAGYSSGEYDSCQGDSGGGLFYRPAANTPTIPARSAESIIKGVVSWGRGCGSADLFGIYTNVSFHENWINKVISKHYQN